MAVHLITCVCIAFCTCTPRLSSTLYSLLALYLSVFLVVILTHPRLCTVSVVAPYRAVNLGCGLTFGIRSHTWAKDTSSVLPNASTFHSQAKNNNSKVSWTVESKVGQLFCPPGLCHVHTFGIRSHTYAKDTSSVLSNACTFHSQARKNNSKLSWTAESKVGQLLCPPGMCHVYTFGIRSHTYAKDTSSLLSNASTFHSQARNNNSKLSWTAESKVGQLLCPSGLCHVHTFGIGSHTYAKDTSSLLSNASTFHSQARNNNSKLNWTAESKVGQLFCPPGLCHVHTFGTGATHMPMT